MQTCQNAARGLRVRHGFGILAMLERACYGVFDAVSSVCVGRDDGGGKDHRTGLSDVAQGASIPGTVFDVQRWSYGCLRPAVCVICAKRAAFREMAAMLVGACCA